MALFGLFGVYQAAGVNIYEDFSQGATNWLPGDPAAWSVVAPTPGHWAYRGDTGGDTGTWDTNAVLDTSWRIDEDLEFRMLRHPDHTGTGGPMFSSTMVTNPVYFNITYSEGGGLSVLAQWYDGAQWHDVLSSGWRGGALPACHVELSRVDGATSVLVNITCTNGFSYGAQASIPASILNELSTPGFRVNGAQVDYSNMSIATPLTIGSSQTEHYRGQAKRVVAQLLAHFWTGDPRTGHIVTTWDGYPTNLPQGVLWERATLYFVLANLCRLTGDITLYERLKADWAFTKGMYPARQLQACGADSGSNWGADDAGWSALMYLDAYDLTGDPEALADAKGLVNAAFNRWLDDGLGGGLWYNDGRQVKSLYQAALLLAALRIYETGGSMSYYTRALKCYTWMERHLLRVDNLYACDYVAGGKVGGDGGGSYHTREVGSDTFLGGNMAMGSLHAWLYRLTDQDVYRRRAIRTAEALCSRCTDTNGVYIDDRDAWADGAFAGIWARDVLTLPGVSLQHWQALWRTADAIVARDMTSDGYLGGDWDGPVGPGSPWEIGAASGPGEPSFPQQVMTSANAANMVVAAGFLENPYAGILPTLSLQPLPSSQLELGVTAEPGWPLRVDRSGDLRNWRPIDSFLSGTNPTFIPVSIIPGQTEQYYRAGLSLNP